MLGADIDTLCVFPKHVEREHFFTVMYDMLNQRPEVTELTVEYIYILLCYVGMENTRGDSWVFVFIFRL